MLRDEIRDLLGHGCKEEEIVAALAMTGSDPDSVRRVLRELKCPPPPKPKCAARSVADYRQKLEERETTLDRRIRIFHVAENRTRAEIGAELPGESAKFIDDELAMMLKVVSGHPPILKLVRGVYRMSEHYRPRPDDERRVRVKKGEKS